MKLLTLEEPLLEFCRGNHIDIRYGIMQYFPFDRHADTAPTRIRVGLVGTSETTEGLRAWLSEAKTGIDAKKTHLINLFPPFPGFSDESCFGSQLLFDDRWTSVLSQREIDNLVAANPLTVVEESVEVFINCARHILENSPLDVLVCAPPSDLLASLDSLRDDLKDESEEPIDEGTEAENTEGLARAQFHDVLKARGMSLGIPIQMIRPPTYGGRRIKLRGIGADIGQISMLQDAATRAWNFHIAMYYKAGGIPWRLVRESSDFSSCFAGISFYRSLDGERLLTSVAQVFNERGEGIIVRGAPANTSKEDRQPHLSPNDAYDLVDNAIKTFRKEHRHVPARIVLHKTSRFTPGEIEGIQSAMSRNSVDLTDIVSISRSFSRLFRSGTYPPLRGTLLQLSDTHALLYTRGSVPFFECYPGMYVPRPLELRIEKHESTVRQVAEEVMALTKLNWNNTQFDGGEPITIRAARRVGDILKCIPDEPSASQPGFRYFM